MKYDYLYLMLAIVMVMNITGISREPVRIEVKEVRNVLPENENKRLMMTVTGYSSVEGCDDSECIMANGRRAYVGAVACPRSWKLGTVVKFENKEYSCMDRLSMKYDNRIDVFFGYGIEAFKEARKFGKRSLGVEIVR